LKRTRNHIIEDESETILKSLLPSEWVLRKLSPDYGIDYLVEIFTKNKATGEHFFIQLKGTDKKGQKGRISYQLSNKHIDYYSKLSLPILLVYISVSTGVVWAKWMNRIVARKRAGSRTISFSSNDLLSIEKVLRIVDNLSPKSNPIRIRYKGIKNRNLLSFLDRWLSNIFKEDLAKSENDIADEISLVLDETDEDSISIRIVDERFLLDAKAVIPNSFEEELLMIPEVDALPVSLEDVFYSFSKALLARNSTAAIRVLLKILPNYEIDDFVDTITIIAKCISNKEYAQILELGKTAIDKDNLNVFQLLYMSLFKYNNDHEVNLIKETLLLHAISKSKDERFTGLLHYNLANHYQNSDKRREAIFHYLQARKKEPDYYNRGYWYRELAGMLFLEKRYSASARIYSKCLTFDRFASEPLSFALAADAHFMARHFEESLELFEKYVAAEKTPDLEFVLKKQAIKTVRDRFGLNGQYSPSTAKKMFEDLCKHNQPPSKEEIDRCLALDPLCPQACFQEGLYLKEEGKYEEACISFLMSALVEDWNIPAWLNSFFMAYETRSHMMGIVLSVAYNKCGYGLLEVLRKEVLCDKRMPIALKNQFIEAMRGQFEIYEKSKEKLV
jgi:tetratricopeptide (TPR) repeat protein